MSGEIIKIKDKRKIDAVTGKPVSDKSRFHANVSSDYIKKVIKSAKKYGNDPYTAIAMNLAETGLKTSYNPFMISLDQYNPYGDAVDQAMKILAEKKKLATKLGKTSEEDIIQAWNGYGVIKDQGRMYGIDTSKNPIDMKKNPVYGKRVVNLRDSVIKQNPEIVKLVDQYQIGGKINNTMNKNTIKPGDKYRSSGRGRGLAKGMGQGPVGIPYNDKLKRYRVIDLYDGQMYDIGGWLGENENAATGGITGVLSGALSGAPLGLPGILAGGLIGGIGGIIGGKREDELEEEQERQNRLRERYTAMSAPRTVGAENMTPNVMAFKKGGGLKGKKKVEYVMGEFKRGKLHSGSKKGPIVKDRKQAIAIALSEAGLSKYDDGGLLVDFYPDDLEFKKGGKWIQKATRSIKRRGTEGVCTGSKFGGPSCPPGSRRYNLAKTFRSMARKRKKKQYGGDMDDELFNDELIELEGPSHEEGGIQFAEGAELEGGETVYNNVVNSDSIVITKELAGEYQLPKEAIGKTVAEYSKVINNKYKDREIDPFAMKSKEVELNNLARMSEEVADIYENEEEKFQPGGRIPKNKNPETWYNRPYRALWETLQEIPFDINRMDERNRLRREQKLLGQEVYNPAKIIPNAANNKMRIDTGEPFPERINPSEYYGEPGTKGQTKQMPTSDFDMTYFRDYIDPLSKYEAPSVEKYTTLESLKPAFTSPVTKTPFNNLSGSGDLMKGPSMPDEVVKPKSGEGLTNALGYASLGIGAFQALRTALDKPEKVRLGRMQFNPMHPELLDPAYQLRNVEDVYATGNEQMRQQSRKDWLRRRVQSATEEAKTKSGVLGQVQAANTQMLNQTKQANIQGKMQTDLTNINIGLQEENINAANIGAWQTARDYQMANLGTMLGEYARDRRLESANERMLNLQLNALNNLGEGAGVKYDEYGNQYRVPITGFAGSTLPQVTGQGGSSDYYYSKRSTYDNPELGNGIDLYSRRVDTGLNRGRTRNITTR